MPNLPQDQPEAQVLHLLSTLMHPKRLDIIHLLHHQPNTSVSKISSSLDIKQSLASQHLHNLRLHELLRTKRKGRHIYYRINYDRLDRIAGALLKLSVHDVEL